MFIKFYLVLSLSFFVFGTNYAQTKENSPICDESKIDWVLPGHFGDALERARQEKRIIMIKGVSFGIDALGATCATKGTW